MINEKCYVVTSLIESVDEGAEVSVLGIERAKREAWRIVSQAVSEVKENYDENRPFIMIRTKSKSNFNKSE